jgi:L-2-hydroxycarboxylate dehydrogenase (NAD+)
MAHVTLENLHARCVAVLTAHGVADADAEICAREVVDAQARGRTAHGVAMIPRLLDWAGRAGRPVVTHESAVAAHLEGNGVLGPVLAQQAMDLAIARARASSLALVGVRNASAFLTAGFQVRRAAASGVVALVASIAAPKLAPWGGRTPTLGTNPIGLGIPSDDGPVVLDLALGTATVAEVRVAAHAGRLLPEGVALDRDGAPTRDADAALEGALLAFGAHKGAALAIAVELLAGPLVGAHAGSGGGDRGMLFLAIDPDVFGLGAAFAVAVRGLAEEVRAGPPREGADEVLMPGDRGERRRTHAASVGVAVPDDAWAHLGELAAGGDGGG